MGKACGCQVGPRKGERCSVNRLHHVGIVVNDIRKTAQLYGRLLGLALVTDIVVDETQRVKVAFLDVGNGVTLELVEPLTSDSPVAKFLNRGGGLHHLCYEVDDIDRAVEAASVQGAIVICKPVPATAFDGRRIAFVYAPDKSLVEFVEKGR